MAIPLLVKRAQFQEKKMIETGLVCKHGRSGKFEVQIRAGNKKERGKLGFAKLQRGSWGLHR